MDDDSGWTVIPRQKGRRRLALQTPRVPNVKTANRYSPLVAFHFRRLPPELQLEVCEFLSIGIEEIRYRKVDLTVPDHLRGWSTPASQQLADQTYCNFLLVDKQMNRQLQYIYCADDYEFEVYNTLTGPVTPLNDTGKERAITAHARSWQLRAYVGGNYWGGAPDYSLHIVLRCQKDPGYRLEWTHMEDSQKNWVGVDAADYEAMVKRVEDAIGAMVLGRRAIDGVRGLTHEGLRMVIAAAYLM